jgi:hypothetical protein
MNISDLRRALDALALLPDSECAALSDLLRPLDEVSLAEFHKLIAPSVEKRAKIEAKA